MRSSRISFWSGLRSESSIRAPRRSPFPESLMATRPPPAAPSTSSCSSSACMASIFDLNSVACFTRPRKSAMIFSASPMPQRALTASLDLKSRECHGLQHHHPAAPRPAFLFVVLRSARTVAVHRRFGRREIAPSPPGPAGRRARHLSSPPCVFRLARQAKPNPPLPTLPPPLCQICNHPAPASPNGGLLRRPPDQCFARTSLQRNFESAIFETDEPHVAFERALD